MQFVSARELRLTPKKVWKKLREHSMGVVTINGQPSFLLTKLNPQDLEQIILIQNRIKAEMALSKMRDQAKQHSTQKLSDEEIDSIIRKTRKERKR